MRRIFITAAVGMALVTPLAACSGGGPDDAPANPIERES